MGIGKVIAMTPANSAYKGVKSVANALGLGGLLGTVDHRARSLKALRKAMKKGDVAAVMRKAASSKYVRVRGIAAAALAGAGDFQQAKAAYQAQQAMRKAGSQWGGSSGLAPGVAQPFQPAVPPVLLPATSATTATPRAARPCAYGPRGADGYCPKRPSQAQRLAATGAAPRASRPCAYGPRGADGYCPKKPAATRSSRATTAAQRRLETAVGSGLTKAGKAAVTAVGGPMAAGGLILKASLVGAAGLAAYWLTSQLMKARFKTWEELHWELANQYRAARQQAAAGAGRGLTPQENAQFSAWFKQKKAELEARQASGESLRSAANLTFKE